MLTGTECVGVKDISRAGFIGSNDNSVGIVKATGWMTEREIVFRVPAENIAIRLFHIVQTRFEAHATSYLRVPHTLPLR
jgi:hypothetical protein